MLKETKSEIFLEWLYSHEAGGSSDRPRHVIDFSKSLNDSEGKEFWRVVTESWALFDRIPHDEFEEQFQRFRDSAPGYSCPDMTVYRGQCDSDEAGLAWTTCRSVARGFADGHRGFSHSCPVVIECVISSEEIAFTCDSRGEKEIVLLYCPDI